MILNPLFGILVGGTTIACALLAATAPFVDQSGAAWRLTGALLFLAGAFLVTIVVNVPLNNALAATDPAGAEGSRVWADYLRRWTAWNHVRTAATTAAAAALALATR